MKLNDTEINILIVALDKLLESEYDTTASMELLDKLNLEIGRILCATCHEWVEMDSEDMMSDYHVGCGSAT